MGSLKLSFKKPLDPWLPDSTFFTSSPSDGGDDLDGQSLLIECILV